MKLRSAIIFPDTVPSEQMLSPLVLVFEPLVYFQTVENDRIPLVLTNPFIDAMTAGSLCRVDVPAPLGKERERFLHLISDIHTRRDDYAAQLSYVSLAAVSTASRSAKESKSSIVSNLLSSKGIEERAADARAMELWQARLVLKLAEMYDADQESLRLELKKLEKRQEAMLGELRKETDNLFVRTGEHSSASLSPVTGKMLHLRCKAWARMYVSGNIRLPVNPVFLSRNKEAVELLIDSFDQVTGQPPLQKGSYSLPAYCPEKGMLQEQLRQFRYEGGAMVEKLHSQLDTTQGVVPEFDSGQWEALVEKFFPEKLCGRVSLRLYSFPGVSARQLFAETFSSGEKSKFGTATEAGFSLGLLEQD